jgi:hypothetical protein
MEPAWDQAILVQSREQESGTRWGDRPSVEQKAVHRDLRSKNEENGEQGGDSAAKKLSSRKAGEGEA